MIKPSLKLKKQLCDKEALHINIYFVFICRAFVLRLVDVCQWRAGGEMQT